MKHIVESEAKKLHRSAKKKSQKRKKSKRKSQNIEKLTGLDCLDHGCNVENHQLCVYERNFQIGKFHTLDFHNLHTFRPHILFFVHFHLLQVKNISKIIDLKAQRSLFDSKITLNGRYKRNNVRCQCDE